MGSSLDVINDTTAPVYVWVGAYGDAPYYDKLLLSEPILDGKPTPDELSGDATAAYSHLTNAFHYRSAIGGFLGADTDLINAMTSDDPDVNRWCLQVHHDIQQGFDDAGYTRLNPGEVYPRHWATLSWIRTIALIDNLGVAWERTGFTGPWANSNHRYSAEEHFGDVNSLGSDIGPQEAVALMCPTEQRRRKNVQAPSRLLRDRSGHKTVPGRETRRSYEILETFTQHHSNE